MKNNRIFWHFIFFLILAVPGISSAVTEEVIVQPFPLLINPQGTYLRTDTTQGYQQGDGTFLPDVKRPPTIFQIGLPVNVVRPGDIIRIRSIGAFQHGVNFPETSVGAIAVFKSYYNTFLAPLKKRTTAGPVVTRPTCTQGLHTDIPQDVEIPHNGMVDIQVPSGATSVAFSVNDCFFADNSDPFSDFGVTITVIRVKTKYMIEKHILNDSLAETDFNNVRMVPSKAYPVISSANLNPKRKLEFRCLDLENGNTAVKGCALDLDLSLKEGPENNGGHAHSEPGRPLGNFRSKYGELKNQPLFNLDIPESGLTLIYESPEVAGVVNMKVTALSPEGDPIIVGTDDTEFTVRINEDLVPINILGLTTQNSPEFFNPQGESHPFEGHYLTVASHTVLSGVIADFRRLQEIDQISLFQLRSTAASLSWGGLYDVGKMWKYSGGGHKGHRKGTDIDLSTDKVFGVKPEIGSHGYLGRKALQQAILIHTLGSPFSAFPHDIENPQTEDNHWHVYLNELR